MRATAIEEFDWKRSRRWHCLGWRTYRENVIFSQKTSERVAPNQHLLLVNSNPLRPIYLRVIIFPQILDLHPRN